MGALRHMISRHFGLSSQLWFLFCSSYRLAVGFSLFFFLYSAIL